VGMAGIDGRRELRELRGFALRRAVFGTLLSAGRPLSVAEIVEALHAHGCTTNQRLSKPPHKVIASLLGHQVNTGRVRRTARATYELVPWPMSRATKWRYEHWWR
jgi:hypothetical protein